MKVDAGSSTTDSDNGQDDHNHDDHRNHDDDDGDRHGSDADSSIADYPAPEGTDLPEQIRGMSNVYEVAYWVATHPDVLSLANEIHNGMKTSLVRGTPAMTAKDAQV